MDTYKTIRFFRSRNAPGSISLMLLLHKDLKQTSTRQLKNDLGNIIYLTFATATRYKSKTGRAARDSFSIFFYLRNTITFGILDRFHDSLKASILVYFMSQKTIHIRFSVPPPLTFSSVRNGGVG